MKKANIQEYYNAIKPKTKEITLVILEEVTAIDWLKLPDLCSAFYQEFDAYLQVQPLGSSSNLEVWLSCKDNINAEEAEDFINSFYENGL